MLFCVQTTFILFFLRALRTGDGTHKSSGLKKNHKMNDSDFVNHSEIWGWGIASYVLRHDSLILLKNINMYIFR